jgi:hypothetical protein
LHGRGSIANKGKTFLHSLQTGSGAHRGRFSRGVKQSGREANHSPSSSAEIKNGEATPPLPHMSLWHSV